MAISIMSIAHAYFTSDIVITNIYKYNLYDMTYCFHPLIKRNLWSILTQFFHLRMFSMSKCQYNMKKRRLRRLDVFLYIYNFTNYQTQVNQSFIVFHIWEQKVKSRLIHCVNQKKIFFWEWDFKFYNGCNFLLSIYIKRQVQKVNKIFFCILKSLIRTLHTSFLTTK